VGREVNEWYFGVWIPAFAGMTVAIEKMLIIPFGE
jgi:hypothetical protein